MNLQPKINTFVKTSNSLQMKKLYFLFLLTIGFLSNAQIVNIPDANFKAKLIAIGKDTNSDGQIQFTEALAVTLLNVSFASISNITGIEAFTNLITLECQNNYLTTLNVQGLTNLEWLACNDNQLPTLNVQGLTNLKNLYCQYNQLPSLNVQGLTNLQILHCYNNQLPTLNLQGLTNLYDLNCSNNQLTSLNVQGLTNLNYLSCQNNQLTSLFIKNGRNETINFSENPNLAFICADDSQITGVQNTATGLGYANCHVNSYCSFAYGGTFYEITGNAKFDNNSNGCDVLDFNYSNLKFSISNNILAGTFIPNQTGNYYIPVQAGNHTITPNLENPTYFNISPTSFSANFPTQASPLTQDFCVTANGIHSDVEIVLLPTTPARPGFDATYKLIYKNKGNQIENGTVTFSMYNPEVVDFVSSLPNFNAQTTNPTLETFTWNYSNLQPFETREIEIILNINSPMETPPVNAGDLLSFDTQIVTSNTDENSFDNFFGIRQEVVNSFDPNDKTCLEGTTIAPSEVGKYVHYIFVLKTQARFQQKIS